MSHVEQLGLIVSLLLYAGILAAANIPLVSLN